MSEHPQPEPFSNQDHTPFSPDERLTPALSYEQMTHTHLLEWEHRPDVIVRVAPWSKEWTGDRMASMVQEGERLFSELTAKYGIAVVPHRNVISGSPDNPEVPTLYTITDRVIGDGLDDELGKPEPGICVEELALHFDGLIRYHAGVMRSGGRYLSDVGRANSQYMYGHTSNDPANRIYLTDIDVITRLYPLTERTEKEVRDMSRSLGGLATSIMNAEQATGYDLTAIIEAFAAQIDLTAIPPGTEFRDKIDNLIQTLTGRSNQ